VPLIYLAMCSRDSSKSLSAAHDMLFIGADLGSKGSTLDLKVANHIFSTISGDIPVSRSLVRLLGSDQLRSSDGGRPSFPAHFGGRVPGSVAVAGVL